MVGPGNYLASLGTGLFVMRLVTVRFPTSFSVAFANLTSPLAEFWRSGSGLLSEKKLGSSDCRDSRSNYDVLLGLHPYLRNGSQSCMEIKVEFCEGVIPLSALLAVYWDRLVFSHSSVWCGFISSSYAQLFLKVKWGRILGVGRYTTVAEVRKIDSPYLETKQMELSLCPAFVVIGIYASESKLSLHSLCRVVFIGV